MPYFVGFVFFCATYFLMAGETTDSLPRSLKELWNLGHIAYFFIFLLLLSYIPLLRSIPSKILILGLLFTALLFGGIIELSQYATGRTPASQDVALNMTGALLAIAFLNRYCERLARKHLLVVRVAVLVLFTVQVIPFATAIVDEFIAYRQFPVLVSNDTPFEINRWYGNANIEIDRKMSANLLKLRLSPGEQYPGISLRHFPRDWSRFDQLVVRIYNPASEPLYITIRVHDRTHETSYLFSDRFNMNTRVQSGWNQLEVGLNRIENAPLSRTMNMREIVDLGIFASGLREERIIYIDTVYLSRRTRT